MRQRLSPWCRDTGLQLVVAGIASIAFAVFVTWPQAAHLGAMVASHQDPLFSMWRLAWIAHALSTNPLHLFDANIFHPETRTLAYSDAMLLEGVLAAPLFWAGVPAVMVYNVLLIGGIAASGVAMFVLARALSLSMGAALVSAAVFTMPPYRTEHFMHLELQWAMWAPLMFWALHRAIDGGSWRWGVLAGVFLWLQALSCVYYGVFLAMAGAALALLLSATAPRLAIRSWPGLVGGAILAAVLTAPYAFVYVRNARALGERDLWEVGRYSALPISYLLSPDQNWLWGWTSSWGDSERLLFPGAIAIGLAAAGVFSRFRRLAWIYGGLALFFAEMSLGVNGRVYAWLLHHTPFLQGLRAPSRFAIMVCAALAVGAGVGVQSIAQRYSPAVRRLLMGTVILLIAAEYANTGMPLMNLQYTRRATLYTVMRANGPGVVVELPMPVPESLPGHDQYYQYWSRDHWFPLVNGYSGYYPIGYIRTLEQMRRFPDDESVARLKRLQVRYVVVHRDFYETEQYAELLLRLHARKELRYVGTLSDPVGEATLFTLEP